MIVNRTNNRRVLTFLSVTAALLVTALASPVIAERLESDSYVIQFGNFNTTAGEKDSTSYSVTDTVGQSFAGPFGQYGSSTYFVGAGFQYIYQIKPFSFSISKLSIDLGELAVGSFNSDSNVLSITTTGAGGYTVYAYELHPLRRQGNTGDIPDTTCNAGTCTHTTAQVWTNASARGFGFNATGTTVPADFVNNTYFRQFANNEAAEPMQAVMTSTNIANNDTATITYKATIGPNQQAGNYQTGIVYVAVPGY